MKTITLLAAALLLGQAAQAADLTLPPPPPVEQVQPPPAAIGWVYGPYTSCERPDIQCVVYAAGWLPNGVPLVGVNLRQYPNGPVLMALANGVPIVISGSDGPWLHVSVACPLRPTGTWSVNTGAVFLACGWF